MNSLPLSHLVISFILRDFTGKTAARSANFFLGLYKIWQGRQLYVKTIWTHCEYPLESLNFVAFTKPNKHKMTSESFSTTWSNLFSNSFARLGEFSRLLQSFVLIRFSQHISLVYRVSLSAWLICLFCRLSDSLQLNTCSDTMIHQPF